MNVFQLANACPVLAGRVTWDTAPTRQPEPYAILHAGPESIISRLYAGRLIVAQSLDVSLYHTPGERTPPQEKLLGAYEWLLARRTALTTSRSGHRFTVVNFAAGQPPEYDSATQGLWANLSFSVQFLR